MTPPDARPIARAGTRHARRVGHVLCAVGMAGGVAGCGDSPMAPRIPRSSLCHTAVEPGLSVDGVTDADIEAAIRHAATVVAPALDSAALRTPLLELIGLRHFTSDDACRRVAVVERALSRLPATPATDADREAILLAVRLAVLSARDAGR